MKQLEELKVELEERFGFNIDTFLGLYASQMGLEDMATHLHSTIAKVKEVATTLHLKMAWKYREESLRSLLDGPKETTQSILEVAERESQRWNAQAFLQEALKFQGERYLYYLDTYYTLDTPMAIGCKIHGTFYQKPSEHLRTFGCSECHEAQANEGKKSTFSQPYYNRPTRLYYIRVDFDDDRDSLYKIGITTRSVSERFNEVPSGIHIVVVVEKLFGTGKLAFDVEQKQLRKFKKHAYTGPKVLPSGNTELFTKDVLGLDNH